MAWVSPNPWGTLSPTVPTGGLELGMESLGIALVFQFSITTNSESGTQAGYALWTLLVHRWLPGHMAARDNRAYQTRAFRNAKQFLKEHEMPCWVHDEDGQCHRRGTIPDHQPPLCHFPDPTLWEGKFMPMCQFHSNKQRGQLRWNRLAPAPTRAWGV